MKNLRLLIILFLGAISTASFAQSMSVTGVLPENTILPSGQRTGPALYDQMTNPSYGFLTSYEYRDAANADYTCWSADDFVVPAGETWNIGTIAVRGSYFYGDPGGATVVNVFIYDDNNGQPGTEIHTFEDITDFYVEEVQDGDYVTTYHEVHFSTPISLTDGTYWLSFQLSGDYTVCGRWGWTQENTNPTIGNMLHWKNPDDGFGSGFVDWTIGNVVLWFPPYDHSFVLYDAPFDNDMAALSLVGPQSSTTLGTAETIEIEIKNEGSVAQTGFDVSYAINGDPAVVENVGGLSVDPNEVVNFTFVTTADLSASGLYDIEISTELSTDQYTVNDSMMAQVVNWGTVYEMEDGVDITACSGTFTDPGGLYANYDNNDVATMTIYPATPGHKVRLNFIEFDVYWADFYIYDGEDTDADLIGYYQSTNSPGIVTALNVTGALTIDFEAPGWANGPGWAALISCYETPEDDFAILDFTRSSFAPFTGRDITFTAELRNLGSLAQSKDVSFFIDNVLVGTVNTGTVNPSEFATVEYTTTIANAGSYSAQVSIPDDNGDDPTNNSDEMFFDVYQAGELVEFFEDPGFPPDFWSTNNWSKTLNPGYGYLSDYAATTYVPAGQYDTLFTPQLHIEAGDMISFYAKTSMWWYGGITVIYKDATTGAITDIEQINTLDAMTYYQYTVDISAAAGNNYIGFVGYVADLWSWGGEIYLDDVIGIGPELYFVDHDMTAYELSGNTTPTVNDPATFNVNVRNIGALDVNAGSYSVKLMMVDDAGDIELQSLNGIALNHLEIENYEFTHTFTASGEAEIYAKVIYSPDMKPENDSTFIIPLNVQVSGTEIVAFDGCENESWQIPSPISTPWTLSETIYAEDWFNGETGAFTGMKYYYINNNYDNVTDVPIDVYIGVTTNNYATQGWVPSTEMTHVYRDTVDFLMGEHEMYIPFMVPFDYQGGNIMVMFFRSENPNAGWTPGINWKTCTASDTITAWSTAWSPPIDPTNPDSTAWPNYLMDYPQTSFFINTAGFGELAGTAYNENGSPFQGVHIQIDGYAIDTITDANGEYFFNELLAGATSVTASMFEYEDNTQSISLAAGMTNYLDFNMELKPQVNVTGTVVGNDYTNNFLEGASVELTGYFQSNAVTDANGEFTLPLVYGNETYTLKITKEGWEDYFDHDVQVAGSNLDLGTITLTELMNIPFAVTAMEDYESVNINWSAPNTGDDLTYDYEVEGNNGYTAEPYENVWLGNLYETTEKGTITSVDLLFWDYSTFSGEVTLDIMDKDGNIVMTTEPFMTVKNEWINIDIEDVQFDRNFYLMVHWQDNPELTDFLSCEEQDYMENPMAKIKYPGMPIEPLENYTGKHATFEMRAHTIIEGAASSNRAVESYNIYKGLTEDVLNADTWPMLNSSPINDTSFVDMDWPPADPEMYSYAVEAIYTTGESVMSFSNIADNLAPTFVSEPEIYAYITVPYEYNVEVEDLNENDIISIMADTIPDWLTLTDNGDGTALLSGTPTELGSYDVVLRATDGSLSSTQSFTIFADPVSVSEIEANDIHVYPNPAIDKLNIEMEGEAELYIMDAKGQVLHSQSLMNSLETINISKLESGVYVLRIVTNDKVTTTKFTVR